MTKVLVLYYSSYGHIEQMADAIAEGARAGGAEVDIRRVKETAPAEVVAAAHFKTDTAHPEIEGPDALTNYDAVIVGAPVSARRPGKPYVDIESPAAIVVIASRGARRTTSGRSASTSSQPTSAPMCADEVR